MIKNDGPLTGITLASSKVPVFKSGMQQKINAVLEEFGLKPKPSIPTQPILEVFEQVVSAAHSLVEARKFQDRIVHDLKIAKMNKKALEADLAAGKPLIKKRPLSSTGMSMPRDPKRSRNL